MNSFNLSVTVNGTLYEREVEPRLLLSDFLRHDLGLTGTHVGCEQGVCGACTILFDNEPARSCLMFAVTAHGHEVITVEGLGSLDDLSPLQESFREAHGLQCGFCTPGIVMELVGLLDNNPDASQVEIENALNKHLCRCTGYEPIKDGALMAQKLIKDRK